MFQQVVFPDAEVAVRSSRVLRRERLVRWGVAAAALAISAAFLFFPISSYLKNSALVDEARLFVEKLAGNAARSPAHGLAAGDAGERRPERRAPRDAGDQRARRLSPVRPLPRRASCSIRCGSRVERAVIVPLLEADGARLLDFSHGRGGDLRIERPERPAARPAA